MTPKGIFIALVLLFTSVFSSFSQQLEVVERSGYTLIKGRLVAKIKPEYRRLFYRKDFSNTPLANLMNDLDVESIERTHKNAVMPRSPKNSAGEYYVNLTGIYTIVYKKDLDENIAAQMFYMSGMFEYVEAQIVPQLMYDPDDPKAYDQYHLELIHAFEAWDIQQGDTNVVIGITDTGIDSDHPELEGRIKHNYNDPIDGIDNDHDGYIDNFTGWDCGSKDNDPEVWGHHGNQVTGCAVANTDNGAHIAAVGFNTMVLPVKICNNRGYLVAAYDGIVYAADHGADIINCSWGGKGSYSQYQQDIINYATNNKGALVVAAAGNSNREDYFYPASYANVISVGGTDEHDEKWTTSNNDGSQYNDKVDLVAPANNIVALWKGGGSGLIGRGTSFASPIVSGVAALIKAQYPDASPQKIGAILQATTDDIYDKGDNNNYAGKLGTGRVNAYKALLPVSTPYITYVGHSTDDGYDQNLAVGDTVELIVELKNQLGATNNVQVTLSSSDNYTSVLESNSFITSIGQNEIKRIEQPFKFIVKATSGINAAASFSLQITDGTHEFEETFGIPINRDYVDITTNNLQLSFNNYGRIGYTYSGAGKGIEYKESKSLIDEMGVLLAVSDNNVLSYEEYELISFKPAVVNSLNALSVSDAQLTVTGTLDDAWSPFAIGVKVEQTAYAWDSKNNEDFVIYEYKIKNPTDQSMNDIYLGMFGDWAIGNPDNNVASYDLEAHLGYAYEPNGVYAGVKTLRNDKINYYAFDQSGNDGINITDNFDDSEEYMAMTNGITHSDVSGNVANLISHGPYTIDAGDSLVLAFAIVGGSDLNTLKQHAHYAEAMYESMRGISLDTNSITHLSCSNEEGGEIDVTPNVGFPPYQITWEHDENIKSTRLEDLKGGDYQVKIEDKYGIRKTYHFQIDTPPRPRAEVTNIHHLTCANEGKGSAKIEVSGGEGAYSYNWNNPEIPSTNQPDLDPGNYIVVVTDSNACADTVEVMIESPTQITIEDIGVIDDVHNLCEGQITVSVNGGTTPYQYTSKSGEDHTEQLFEDLCGGQYIIEVTDANGCVQEHTYEVKGDPTLANSLINIDENNLKLSFDQYGGIGYSFTGAGEGITYKSNNHLIKEMGVSIGFDQNDVRSYREKDFIIDKSADQNTTSSLHFSNAQKTVTGTLKTKHNSSEANIKLTQTAYAWSTPNHTDYVIYEYTLLNTNETNLKDVYLGIFTDWFIGDGSNNNAQYDPELDLGYVFEPQGVYAGVKPLRSKKVNYYAFDQSGNDGINITDNFEDSEYYHSMTNGVTHTEVTGDVASMVAQGPFTIQSGDSIVLAFAVIAGDNIETLASHAQHAENQYEELRGIKIDVNTITPIHCKGDQTGSIDLTVNAGFSPYSVHWSHDSLTRDIILDHLPQGNYSIEVVDNYDFSKTMEFTVTEPEEVLSAELTSLTHASCASSSDGEASISVVGGTGDYHYTWSDPTITEEISPQLKAGDYTLTVHDENGCEDQLSFTIQQPDRLKVNPGKQFNDSLNICEGSFTVDVEGGSSPYSYTWKNGEEHQGNEFSGLCGGTYHVTITDVNGCNTQATYVLDGEHKLANSTITINQNNLNVSFDHYGGIGYSFTGDGIGFEYKGAKSLVNDMGVLIGIQNDQVISYQDKELIVKKEGVENTLTSLSLSDAQQTVSGTLTNIDPSNRTAINLRQTAYAWNTLQHSDYIIYEYTIVNEKETSLEDVYLGLFSDWAIGNQQNNQTDFNVVKKLGYAFEPNGIYAGIKALRSNKVNYYAFDQSGTDGVNISDGFTDDEAYSTMSGGITHTVASGNIANILTQGPFTIKGGDSLVLAFALVAGDQLESLTTTAQHAENMYEKMRGITIGVNSITNVTCKNEKTGVIDLDVDLGFPPYEVIWQHDSLIKDVRIDNLAEGDYNVEIKDRFGFDKKMKLTVNGPSNALKAEVISIENTSCYASKDGSLTLEVSGGTGGYYYEWDDPSIPPIPNPKLKAGEYQLTVSDLTGCKEKLDIEIASPDTLNMYIGSQKDDLHNRCEGEFTVIAWGGTGPYFYSWNDGPVQSDNTFEGLCGGDYDLKVIDANGCEYVDTYTIGSPNSQEEIGTSVNNNLVSEFLFFPNPANEYIVAEFNSPSAQDLNITVVDFRGQLKQKVFTSSVVMGKYKVVINTEPLKSGVYFMNIYNSEGLASYQFEVIH